MKISNVNGYQPKNAVPNFKANLFVCKSVGEVVKENADVFKAASRRCDEWLKSSKAHVKETMQIRKNTEFDPKVAFVKWEYETTFEYPHEETGYTHTVRREKLEDLEFQVGNRKCGFWFDKSSSENKLLEDFKNVFNYLTGNN